MVPGPVWILPAMPFVNDTPDGKTVTIRIWINVNPLPDSLPTGGYPIYFSTDHPELLTDLPSEVDITQIDTIIAVTSVVLTTSQEITITATDTVTSKTRTFTLNPGSAT